MSAVAQFLLEQCFWQPLDGGTSAEQTPLMLGRHHDQSLIEILQTRFGLSAKEAEFEIEAARHEVQL